MVAPLAPVHSTLMCRGTPVGNRWLRLLRKEKNCLKKNATNIKGKLNQNIPFYLHSIYFLSFEIKMFNFLQIGWSNESRLTASRLISWLASCNQFLKVPLTNWNYQLLLSFGYDDHNCLFPKWLHLAAITLGRSMCTNNFMHINFSCIVRLKDFCIFWHKLKFKSNFSIVYPSDFHFDSTQKTLKSELYFTRRENQTAR